MIPRVKWNERRVCREGAEIKLPNVTLRAPGANGQETVKVASWLVSRGNTFARVAIAAGVEWRQPLECTMVARTAPTPQPVIALSGRSGWGPWDASNFKRRSG